MYQYYATFEKEDEFFEKSGIYLTFEGDISENNFSRQKEKTIF